MEIKLTLSEDEAIQLLSLLDYWGEISDTMSPLEEGEENLPRAELCNWIAGQLETQIPVVLENPEIIDCYGNCGKENCTCGNPEGYNDQ